MEETNDGEQFLAEENNYLVEMRSAEKDTQEEEKLIPDSDFTNSLEYDAVNRTLMEEHMQEFVSKCGGLKQALAISNHPEPLHILYKKKYRITGDFYMISNGKAVFPIFRVRMAFKKLNDVQIDVYSKSIFSSIAKIFGMQVVTTSNQLISCRTY